MAAHRTQPPRTASAYAAALALGLALLGSPLPARAALPEIRSSASNPVPACVTPERLMAFLAANNARLEARYRDIARWYKRHGEALKVRWDYAFFQMALETNYLAFRRGDGRPGDVKPGQNNFAGIGATGGGAPGDSFPDISTGVLAQMQHLVAYSGERVASPVAPRTALKQDDIVSASQRLARPVRFSDLTNRWAADRAYHRSIEAIADRYRAEHCGASAAAIQAPPIAAPVPARRVPVRTIWRREEAVVQAEPAVRLEPIARPASEPEPPARAIGPRLAGLADVAAQALAPLPTAAVPTPLGCEVARAGASSSPGVLVRSLEGGRVRYTALGVVAGFETAMAESFIAGSTRNGAVVGMFDSASAALTRANELCGSRTPQARTASYSEPTAE
ncbi:MAG: hypothetical protein AB1749_09875 [Pseudomonadota bacterium]